MTSLLPTLKLIQDLVQDLTERRGPNENSFHGSSISIHIQSTINTHTATQSESTLNALPRNPHRPAFKNPSTPKYSPRARPRKHLGPLLSSPHCLPLTNRSTSLFYLSEILAGTLRRACTVISYSASLKANKNAAVITLWVTLGPMP